MNKVPFDIKEIRVSQSSMDGYGLDVFLKSGLQMKSKFHDADQYAAAVAANGNLTALKNIFWDWIQKVLKENPNYEYHYSTCELYYELLGHIMESPDEHMYVDAIDLLRACAVEKNIEFDGYFNQRFQESEDTIVNFDEDYFEDHDRSELYVYLAASVDEEISEKLQQTFRVLFAEELTPEMIAEKIKFLTKEKGVRF